MGKKILCIAIGIIIGIWIHAYGWPMFLDRIHATNREMGYHFRKIKPGMSEEHVVDIMGQPMDQGKRFYLGQLDGNEFKYRAAKRSGSAYFMEWRHADLVYSVGFDKDGKAVFKAKGGS